MSDTRVSIEVGHGDPGSPGTLVMIPGLMCDGRIFHRLLPMLSSGQAVFLADISKDSSMPAMAQRILNQVCGRLNIVGFSMGGMVAMEMLRLAPERTHRLALLDTNDLEDSADTRAWRGRTIQAVRGGALQRVMTEELIPRYFAPTRTHAALARECLDMALCLGPEVFERQFQALANRSDHRGTLLQFDGPSLVLRGREDHLCDEKAHRRMAEALVRSQYVEIEGASHLSVMEAPHSVAQALNGWLKE